MSDQKLTYKDAVEELENIVNDIENENIDVDELAKKEEKEAEKNKETTKGFSQIASAP